jgi:hypothetical protein
MKKCLLLAFATARALARHPLTISTLLGSMGCIALARPLALFAFGRELEMAREVGLAGVSLAGLLLSIFGVAVTLGRDVSTGAVRALIALPMGRTSYVLGRSIGVFLVAGLSVLVLCIALQATLGDARVGAASLASAALFLSLQNGPLVAISTLSHLLLRSGGAMALSVASVFACWLVPTLLRKGAEQAWPTPLVPDLALFDLTPLFSVGSPAPAPLIGLMLIYTLAATGLLLSLSASVAAQREFSR